MSLDKISKIGGTMVPVLGADIDTDRIIPARFLKCITFDDLAGTMFWDERFDEQNVSKNHPIDAAEYQGASIILGGTNFGCGSSREHAPQAIKRSGIAAIVAESFAEIFFGNSVGIGLPCVCATTADLECLQQVVLTTPSTEFALDLEALTLCWEGGSVPVTMPDTAREALTSGRWDAVAELMGKEEKVDALAQQLPAAGR